MKKVRITSHIPGGSYREPLPGEPDADGYYPLAPILDRWQGHNGQAAQALRSIANSPDGYGKREYRGLTIEVVA